MRTLLRVSMDVEAANQALESGRMQQTMDGVLSKLNPECAYFTTVQGRRTALIVFDLKDPSMIPQIAEPFFKIFRAEVELSPVMNREELMKGLQGLQSPRKAA